jgi:hypothetical protein
MHTYCSRYYHRRRGNSHQRAGRLTCDRCKALLLSFSVAVSTVHNATEEKTHAHDKQEIGEDRADHGRFDDVILLISKCNDADLQRSDGKFKSLSIFGVGHSTINSTALPNVAFRSPPRASPSRSDISSVANDRTAARGMIARKLSTKIAIGSNPVAPAAIPTGTKTNKKLT